jgi:hypothetical protein
MANTMCPQGATLGLTSSEVPAGMLHSQTTTLTASASLSTEICFEAGATQVEVNFSPRSISE